MADGEAFHLVAQSGAGEQDLGWPCTQLETRRSANRAAALLRIAAVNVGRTDTALGAFYRRLAARIGKAKAVTATARKLAVLFYRALRFGLAYADRGASHYEARYRQRVIHSLQRRAREFGFSLIPNPTAGVGVSQESHGLLREAPPVRFRLSPRRRLITRSRSSVAVCG